jgi:protein-disulfide isomerase
LRTCYNLGHKKNPWIIIGVVTVVLFVGAFYLAGQAQEQNNVGIELKTQVKGNPDAAVVLTKYSDFQCPACQGVSPFVAELVEQYADDLRFEYKHFPLEQIHPYALQAAMAAEAAGQQDQFFAYHDLLFENLQQWSSSPAPTAFFTQYAEELELDMDQFRRHSNASVLRDKARADLVEGRDSGVTGTPTFFLNGEPMKRPNGDNLPFGEIAARVAVAIDPSLATTTSEQNADEAVVGEQQGEPVRFGI